MLKEIVHRFTRGVSRRPGSDAGAPYALTDARVVANGAVDAEPEAAAYAAGPTLTKPFVRHNGSWVEDADYAVAASVRFGRRLYVMLTETATGDYLFRVYDEDWDPDTNPSAYSDDIPAVSSNAVSVTHNSGLLGIKEEWYAEYLLIPYNSRGESGAWFQFGVRAPAASGRSAPDFEVYVTDETERVEVYRTREFPYAAIDPNQYDLTLYYMETVQVGEDSGLSILRFSDTRIWEQPWEYDTSTGEVDPVPTRTLDRPRNVFYEEYQMGTDPLTPMPHAAVGYNHSGVAHWGNVAFPTQRVLYGASESGGSTGVKVQYEYDTPSGKVYGPVRDLGSSIGRFTARVRGAETALLVFVEEPAASGDYYLFERLEADSQGRYNSEGGSPYSPYRPLVAYDYEIYAVKGQQTSIEPYAETAYVEEPDRVLVSYQNAPRDVLYQGFSTPDGRDVVAVAGARLAESEGLRAYDYYLFSDEGSWVVRRDGYAFFLDALISGVGCASVAAGGATVPLLVQTHRGVAFVGSNGRVYEVSGRAFRTIDDEVAGPGTLGDPLWAEIKDIGYDPYADEVLLLTDTGLHRFAAPGDGRAGGWVSHVAEEAADHVGSYSDETGSAVFVTYPDTGSGRSAATLPRTGDSGTTPRATAAVETQPLEGAAVAEFREVRADYDWRLDGSDDPVWATAAASALWSPSQTSAQTFDLPANRVRRPRVAGRLASLTVAGFSRLRSIRTLLDIR